MEVMVNIKHFLIVNLLFLSSAPFLQGCQQEQVINPPSSIPDPTYIQGIVMDEEGHPIADALVRIKTTESFVMSRIDGTFTLVGLQENQQNKVTAYAPGFYIGGGEEITPGSEYIEITLYRHHDTDNHDYAWLPSTFHPGEGENQGCAECHSSVGSELGILLPVDEWLLDAHSKSANNPRFLSMFLGTDVDGNQSPLTRFVSTKDYGRLPLSPDRNQPYYGPGYKLDFPDSNGNCAACHTPLAAVDNSYGIDPSTISGAENEGISCDFCHKVWGVDLEVENDLPQPNMPGVLSFIFRRPPEGHQFFAGPLDDVSPGEDTYLPLQQESQFCAPCHFGVFWDTLVYNSYGEWLESPYNNQDTGMTCQDCHMPPTGATLFALPERGGEVRNPYTIFSHYMPGAMDDTLLQNALTMTVNAVRRGNQLVVDISLTNDRTGHHVPTDSPMRHLILLVLAEDINGKSLEQLSGLTLPNWVGVGDPSLGYYAGLPGQAYAKVLAELWTEIYPSGAYWNPTRLESDNRLEAFQTDLQTFTFLAPQETTRIEVQLWYRRAFKDLMDQKGWQDPDILMEQVVLEVPVN